MTLIVTKTPRLLARGVAPLSGSPYPGCGVEHVVVVDELWVSAFQVRLKLDLRSWGEHAGIILLVNRSVLGSFTLLLRD